jgi:hypothetical protein
MVFIRSVTVTDGKRVTETGQRERAEGEGRGREDREGREGERTERVEREGREREDREGREREGREGRERETPEIDRLRASLLGQTGVGLGRFGILILHLVQLRLSKLLYCNGNIFIRLIASP